MLRKEGIFGYDTNLEDRLIPGFPELLRLVEILKDLKYRIVLTQGKYNNKHYGHERYLQKARAFGDFLIVGVDSDEKVRAKKGPDYPLIPHIERIEGLAHTRHVDALFLKEEHHEHWALIKAVRPDVLVVSESTKAGGDTPLPPYSPEEMKHLKEFCGRIEVLPPQATESTSARWRLFQIGMAEKIGRDVLEELSAGVPTAVRKAISKYTEAK
ncbi:MAG: adenylyltransferase/cytidyltransferase family protein [Minisyncoccia bacterium]